VERRINFAANLTSHLTSAKGDQLVNWRASLIVRGFITRKVKRGVAKCISTKSCVYAERVGPRFIHSQAWYPTSSCLRPVPKLFHAAGTYWNSVLTKPIHYD